MGHIKSSCVGFIISGQEAFSTPHSRAEWTVIDVYIETDTHFLFIIIKNTFSVVPCHSELIHNTLISFNLNMYLL